MMIDILSKKQNLFYRRPRLKVSFILISMFALSALVRFLVALYTSENPSIMPDESLYMGLSRSLFDSFSASMTGQPVRYEYLIYPLLLSPLHLLPPSVNIFRAMQFVNCLMMSSSVFFAYLIGKQICLSRKKALFVALISLILPDMVMTIHIMSESVAYPLMLLALYLGVRCIKSSDKLPYALFSGVVSALLFFIKPGLFAVGAVLLIILVYYTIKEKSRQRLFEAVSLIVGFFMVFAIFKLILYLAVAINPLQQSLYASQADPFTFTHLKQTLNGLFLYCTYLPLAFMLVPLLLPLSQLTRFKGKRKSLALLVLLTIAAIAIGTVYMIYVDEFIGELENARIHVRYVAAFLPVLCAFCLTDEVKNARLNGAFVTLFATVAAGLLAFGFSGIRSGRDYPVDAILLSLFTFEDGALNYPLLFSLITFGALIASGFYLYKKQKPKLFFKVGAAVITAVLILTNITGYLQNMHAMDTIYTEDANEVKTLVPQNPVLAVADGGYFKQTRSALEVPYRSAFMLTEVSDLIDNLDQNGFIKDFVPDSYWHTSGQNRINFDNTIIFAYNALDNITFSENVKISKTQNGLYHIATFDKSQPVIASALSHTSEGYAAVGTLLTVFDSDLKQSGKITLRLKAYTNSGSAKLTLSCGEQSYTYNITSAKNFINATFDVIDPALRFEITLRPEPNSNRVYLDSYTLSGAQYGAA